MMRRRRLFLARSLSIAAATVSYSSSSSSSSALSPLSHRSLLAFSSSSSSSSNSNNKNHHHHHDVMTTVEWSPKVAKLYDAKPEIFQKVVTHWVFPDLPRVYTAEHRESYWKMTAAVPSQRIQTLATCHHGSSSSSSSSSWQSLVQTAQQRLLAGTTMTMTTGEEADGGVDQGGSSSSPRGKLLLVGGNDKAKETTTTTPTSTTLSTIQAATILRSELWKSSSSSSTSSSLADDVDLWGVADPNDPDSPAKVQAKIDAGITGFLTQPLLTSTAWDTLRSYPITSTTDSKNKHVPYVVGMALPQSAQNLQFWKQLLDRPELLENDPLFQSHLAYFSQPYTTSLAWIGRELQQYYMADHAATAAATTTAAAAGSTAGSTNSCTMISGVHFMPLQNTADLESIFKSLSRQR